MRKVYNCLFCNSELTRTPGYIEYVQCDKCIFEYEGEMLSKHFESIDYLDKYICINFPELKVGILFKQDVLLISNFGEEPTNSFMTIDKSEKLNPNSDSFLNKIKMWKALQ